MIAPRVDLRVQVFADGANLEQMKALAEDPNVRGFTTNPTLMRQSGIRDYAAFAREVLKAIPDKPISFEVLADTPAEVRRQALAIASWGDNVYVKVPITTSEGEPLTGLAGELSHRGVKVNVTKAGTYAIAVGAAAGHSDGTARGLRHAPSAFACSRARRLIARGGASTMRPSTCGRPI